MCAVSHASNNHQDLYHIIQGHLASSEMPFGEESVKAEWAVIMEKKTSIASAI